MRGENPLDLASSALESGTAVASLVNQGFSAARNPYGFLIQQLAQQSANVTWTKGSSRQLQSTSQDIPSVLHWGVVNFEGSPALHIKGYMTIDSVGSGSF